MFKYTKKDVIDIATKNGFIVNNTEKSFTPLRYFESF